MRLLLNLIWLIFGGLVMAFGYAVVALLMLITGVLMCITIIGIPLGLANFKLIPVCRDIVDLEQARRLRYGGQVAVPVDPSRSNS